MSILETKSKEVFDALKCTVVKTLECKELFCPGNIIDREVKAALLLRVPGDCINWVAKVMEVVYPYCRPMSEGSDNS